MVTKGVPNDLELALDHDEEVVNFTAEFGERFVLEVLHLVEMLDKSDQVYRRLSNDGTCHAHVLIKEGQKELQGCVDLEGILLLLLLEARGRLRSHILESRKDTF